MAARNKRSIFKIDIKTLEVLEEFPSVIEAAIATTGSKGSRGSISKCANGKVKSSIGYIWRFKDKEKHVLLTRKPINPVKVDQYNFHTREFIKTWDSVTAAARHIGVHSSSIFQCLSGRCKISGGFFWERTPVKK